jgi:Protein of unknown function (DUF2924)
MAAVGAEHGAFGQLADCDLVDFRHLRADQRELTSPTLVRARRRLRTSLSEALIVPPTAEDGFEYEGQRYRSLTVIAEQITGAHWSGPRFFGVSKRARAS